MEYHAHSAVNQFPESRISVTCPLPAGARRKLSRPSSFQPRECQGICAYCCVDDWLCGVQRIFAICEHHDIEAQIQRECVARGLPEPSVMTRLPAIKVGKQLREPLRFRRFRKKRDLEQPDRQGSFWRVQF